MRDSGICALMTLAASLSDTTADATIARDLLFEKALYQAACKAAIKANQKLSLREAEELLKECEKLENPYTCPHGRPIVISISKRELEKKFKRIV